MNKSELQYEKNKIHEGIADSLFSELTNFQNLSALVKSVAYGMPIALLVGFFPQILNSFITDMPKFFADKKFAKEFEKYCISRAEELKKTPEIQNAIRKGNTKGLIAAIKKNMSSKDAKIHREALHRGLGKRQSDIDATKYAGERDSGLRDDIIALNLKGAEDHAGGIYPKLAKILKSKKKPSTVNAKEEPEEFPAGYIPAMAESKNTMKKSELKALIQEVVEEVKLDDKEEEYAPTQEDLLKVEEELKRLNEKKFNTLVEDEVIVKEVEPDQSGIKRISYLRRDG
jgi:ribosomal protein S20